MLLIDDRVGSKDLLRPLQQSGLPAELAHLEFADIAFVGRGIDDTDLYIGIELKETTDLISSMQSGRFSGHQLPGLVSTYDRAWLVTEGLWKTGDEGVLEHRTYNGWSAASGGTTKRVMTNDLESWLLTQIIRGGLNHWHANTRRDTIRFVSALFRWWTHKSLDEHRSHSVIYLPSPDRAIFTEPSVERKMLSCIPKVGWDKSGALHDAFGGSLRRVLAASAKELTAVPGVGGVIASNIGAIK